MSTLCLAQNQGYTEIQKNQRLELKSNNHDYLELEKSWLEDGFSFPALVNYIQTPTEKQFYLKSYKDIQPERVESIKARLESLCPNLVFLSIDNHDFSVFFSNNAPEEEIIEFFRLIGYNHYEITE